MPVILYLLYGQDERYERQMIFSLLTALRCLGEDRSKCRIAVLSDRPQAVAGLPVEHHLLTAEEIDTWSNHGQFYHRLKPMALRRMLEHYGAPVALIDTDTGFRANPMALFARVSPTQSVMHCYEYPIGTNALLTLPDKLGEGMQIGPLWVTRYAQMYNSGVVGMHPENLPLLDVIVEMTDRLHAIGPHFTSEQLATSLVLQSLGQVVTCEDVVDHYWTYRRSYCMLMIDRFLAKQPLVPVDDAIRATGRVSLDFPRKSLRDRVWTRVLARFRQWNGDHQYVYLLYRTALYYGRRDPEMGSLWARSALSLSRDIVRAVEEDRAQLGRELARIEGNLRYFSLGRIDRLTWLDPEVRSVWREFWQRGHGDAERG